MWRYVSGILSLLLIQATFAGTTDARDPGDTPRADPPVRQRDRHGDPLPPGAIARLGTVRFRHLEGLREVVLSPSGKVLATHSFREVELWDVNTGRRTALWNNSGNLDWSVRAIAWHPTENRLLIGTTDRSSANAIHSWPVERNKDRILLKEKSTSPISALAIYPDGTHVVVGHEGGDLKVYRMDTGQVVTTVRGDGKRIRQLAVCAKKGWLRWIEDTGWVWELDQATGKTSRRLQLPTIRSYVEMSRDGRYVAAYDETLAICVWDVATGEQCHCFEQMRKDGFCQVFFGEGAGVVGCVGRREGMVRLWDLQTGKPLRRFRLPAPWGRRCSASLFLPSRQLLVTCDDDSALAVWDSKSGKAVSNFDGHGAVVERMGYTPDGRTLISVAADGAIQWKATSGAMLGRASIPISFPCDCFCMTSSGNRGAADFSGKTVVLWDLATGEVVKCLTGERLPPIAMAFSAGGERLATGERNGFIQVWESATGRLLVKLDTSKRTKDLTWLAFSPDKRVLASGDGAITVHLWDLQTGSHVKTLKLKEDKWQESRNVQGAWASGFSRDGRRILAQDWGKLQLWDLERGEDISNIPALDSYRWIGSELSPDGRLLTHADATVADQVPVSEFFQVALWEVASGQRLCGFPLAVSAVAFSPDGRTIATADRTTGSIVIWDIKQVLTLKYDSGTRMSQSLLWEALAARDVKRSYGAVACLLAHADLALALAKTHLQPITAPLPSRVAALIAQLDSDSFAERDRAMKQLQQLGEMVQVALLQAHAKTRSQEVKRRTAVLLERLRQPSPEYLREQRAMFVLEWLHSPEARQQLRRIAEGLPNAPRTRQARAALARWGKGAGRK